MFDTHLACAGKTQPRAIGLPSPKPPAGRSGDVSRGPTREPGVSEGTNLLAQALSFALTRLTLESTRPAATTALSLSRIISQPVCTKQRSGLGVNVNNRETQRERK